MSLGYNNFMQISDYPSLKKHYLLRIEATETTSSVNSKSIKSPEI